MSFNFQIDSQVKVYATSGAFPATGVIRTIYIDKSSDTAYYWDDATSTYKSLGGGGSGSVVWGAITGTLADQTDLQNALNAKVPYSGATSNVDLGEYQIKVGQLELDQTPTGTTGIAKIRWNDTDGTIDVGLKGGNVTLQVGLEELVRVVNKSGASLAESAYQAVRVRLVSEGGAAGQRLAVVLAQANNDLNSATTIGIVTETIANNQEGFINRGGEVRGINTTGSLQGETWVDGDILYLSPTTPGALTNIKPTAPDHSITIGYVVYSHAVNGKIFVKVDNGYELEELHNVTATDYSTPSDADSLLIYQSSESLWKRLTWANVKAKLKTYFDTVYQAVLVSGTNIKTIEGQSILGAGNIDLTKSDVGLGNVDNTSDLNKPISTATQTALNAKQNTLTLTTTGTSGAATLVGATLNIPQYGSGSSAAFGVHSQKFIPSGSYTSNTLNFGTITSVNILANRINLAPYFPNQTFTCQSISIQVAGAIAGGLARIIIYSDVNGLPSAKLYESADLDCSTTGIKTATVTFSFTAGATYWIGVAGNNASISLNFIPAASMYSFGNTTNLSLSTYVQAVITYPTLPATLTTLTYVGNAFPFISIRKS